MNSLRQWNHVWDQAAIRLRYEQQLGTMGEHWSLIVHGDNAMPTSDNLRLAESAKIVFYINKIMALDLPTIRQGYPICQEHDFCHRPTIRNRYRHNGLREKRRPLTCGGLLTLGLNGA